MFPFVPNSLTIAAFRFQPRCSSCLDFGADARTPPPTEHSGASSSPGATSNRDAVGATLFFAGPAIGQVERCFEATSGGGF